MINKIKYGTTSGPVGVVNDIVTELDYLTNDEVVFERDVYNLTIVANMTK